MNNRITDIKAREILDSRGNPAVETDCILESGVMGRAAVPSGASTGSREALELRDGDRERYHGKGVLEAIDNVNSIIGPEVIGGNCTEQRKIDLLMCDMDGTDNKSNLGANSILSVSMAVARAASINVKLPLYRYLGGVHAFNIPVPQCNIINGGEHAGNNLDIQEFMIVPYGFDDFRRAIQSASEVFHNLKKIMSEKGYSTGVGDEGGFAPDLSENEEALLLIIKAIEESGYTPGKEIGLALDVAASEFFEDEAYLFEGRNISSEDLIDIYANWCDKYPIVSIEDGMAELDWEGWKNLNNLKGSSIQIVGDDIFVTNTKIIEEGIKKNVANSVLIKLNQIGTVTETIEAINLAVKNGWTTVVSHRSGETTDVFISHLAVGLNTGQIKTGSISRGERIEKYNELLRIQEELGNEAEFRKERFF